MPNFYVTAEVRLTVQDARHVADAKGAAIAMLGQIETVADDCTIHGIEIVACTPEPEKRNK